MKPLLQFKDIDETTATGLAARLLTVLKPCDVVAFSGDLGAGKSHFCRAIIRQALSDDRAEVPSPTFTLVQPYETPRGTILHYDLYRLEEPEELYELGFQDGREAAISLIEWPEKMGSLLPQDGLVITINMGDKGAATRHYGLFGDDGWQQRLKNL